MVTAIMHPIFYTSTYDKLPIEDCVLKTKREFKELLVISRLLDVRKNKAAVYRDLTQVIT